MVEGRVDLGGWLHSEMVYPPTDVTHPGTNRVWRSATTLIEASTLPISQTADFCMLLTVWPSLRYTAVLYVHMINIHNGVKEILYYIFSGHSSIINSVKTLRQRVDFKIAVLVFQCLTGHAPAYLADDCQLAADAIARRLHSADTAKCVVGCTYNNFGDPTGALQRPDHVCATRYHST